jgi:hypothetical protein
LHERLAAGRVPRLAAADIRQFAKVMREGSDREREIVLGLIGLRYNPDCRHVLDFALASPQASVRVQAAAVFVKLRARYKALLKRCLGLHGEAGLEQGQMLEVTHDLLETLESGFLDSSEARQAQSAVRNLSTKLELAQATEIPDRELKLLTGRLLAVQRQHEVDRTRSKLRIKRESPELQHLRARSRHPIGRRVEHRPIPDRLLTTTISQPAAAALPDAPAPHSPRPI